MTMDPQKFVADNYGSAYGEQLRRGFRGLRFTGLIEKEFRESYIAQNLPRARLSGLIALIIVLAVTCIDLLLGTATASTLNTVRLGVLCPLLVAFAIGSAERAPLRSASCDGALALDVIEHLDDDAAALSETARVVRPGGFLLVTVPALPSLWGNQDVVSHHRRRYTSRSLAAAFRRAGLDLTWQSYFNTVLFPAIASVRWTRRALGRVAGDDSDFESGSKPSVIRSSRSPAD